MHVEVGAVDVLGAVDVTDDSEVVGVVDVSGVVNVVDASEVVGVVDSSEVADFSGFVVGLSSLFGSSFGSLFGL